MLMAVKATIDFHAVEVKHREIHVRLENWARWCNGRNAPETSPMFRLYRAPARARGAEHTWSTVAVDGMDAQRIAKAVGHLPELHRKALHWSYIRPVNPRRAASDLGTTLDGLALLVRDGRQMLVNRNA
jgi:DNA-directed RNA polymerase specialized sigma24 family protein